MRLPLCWQPHKQPGRNFLVQRAPIAPFDSKNMQPAVQLCYAAAAAGLANISTSYRLLVTHSSASPCMDLTIPNNGILIYPNWIDVRYSVCQHRP